MDNNYSKEDSIDVDWNTDDELEINGETVTSHPPSHPIHSVTGSMEASTSFHHLDLVNYFVEMGFSARLVSKAIEENGESDRGLILETLLTYSTLGDSSEQLARTNSDPSPSTTNHNEVFEDDISDIDCWSEEEVEGDSDDSRCMSKKKLLTVVNTGSLSEKEKKVLALANMGYSTEEASIAIDRCGLDASIYLLTDFICAAQTAREEDYLHEDDLKKKRLCDGSMSNKKRKHHQTLKNKPEVEENIRLPIPMIGFGVPGLETVQIRQPLPDIAKKPPFFYYENVALTPKGVWDTISRFLYDIEPEFVDSKYFCAAARKRGYIHNLPTENRFPLIPLPPLTIQQAFPLSKKWWPSWDPREKLNCLQTAYASAQLTDRIRDLLENFDGEPSADVKKEVLYQCRKWNLVWVGKNKLAPLEPDEVEMLLGFPKNHTRGGGVSRTDRYKSLGNSFQVDTVAYHLSVLKDMYPNGVNVLSLFSGIGGAEVALHRLGIKLKNVVSVEKSKVNRGIVRSWWEQTNQTGSLIDFDDVQLVDGERLEQIMGSIGGFDLVVGGSPCNNLAGSNRVSRDGLEGKESSLFFDYFRILDIVKSIMCSSQSHR